MMPTARRRCFGVIVIGVGLSLTALNRVYARPDVPAGTPAALLEGQRIEWADLVPALTEAAGGLILEELILSRVLETECTRLGIKIDEASIDAERLRLVRTLAEASQVSEEEGSVLIERVRAARGLGDTRFASTLRRNAMLRALVRSGKMGEKPADVSDEDVRQAHTLKYGPRVRVRLILVRQETDAAAALARVKPHGDGTAGESFSDVASEISIDPSGAQGGRMEPFSLEDANFPIAFRRAIRQLEVGQVSEPIGVSWEGQAGSVQGFAVVRLDEQIEARPDAPSLPDATAKLREEVMLVRERAAMDRLARRLVREARVTVFDRSLDKSWKRQLGE